MPAGKGKPFLDVALKPIDDCEEMGESRISGSILDNLGFTFR